MGLNDGPWPTQHHRKKEAPEEVAPRASGCPPRLLPDPARTEGAATRLQAMPAENPVKQPSMAVENGPRASSGLQRGAAQCDARPMLHGQECRPHALLPLRGGPGHRLGQGKRGWGLWEI